MLKTNIIKIQKENKEYPEVLRKIKNAPQELYAMGNIKLLNKKEIIAIVGSRNCTEYGRHQSYYFSSEIAKENITVISGMAIGIDAAAHLGAAEEKGKTIAVIGGGFKHIYPKENEWLFYKILQNDGCIITEYEPYKDVKMENFPKRNRIISGLANTVLIIEAKEKSGSGITARYAKEQGKKIFCIPSNIDSVNGNGTNLLIQEGATLVTKPNQIIEKIKEKIEIQKDKLEIKSIPNQYKEIYRILKEKPMYTNEISRILEINLSELISIITMMEMDGYIEQVGANKIKIKGE